MLSVAKWLALSPLELKVLSLKRTWNAGFFKTPFMHPAGNEYPVLLKAVEGEGD